MSCNLDSCRSSAAGTSDCPLVRREVAVAIGATGTGELGIDDLRPTTTPTGSLRTDSSPVSGS